MFERADHLSRQVRGVVVITEQTFILKLLAELLQGGGLLKIGISGDRFVREVNVNRLTQGVGATNLFCSSRYIDPR